MSPEQEHEFETVWPNLSVRLTAFLARKGVPIDQREDLVQETGARLVSNWDKVDTARPTWPLAMTIALNLVRDRARKLAEREVVTDIPDLPLDYDLEAAGIARLELDQVRDALLLLSVRQREVILAEIGRETATAQSDKMTRSRARRKLNHLVGRVSAGLGLQVRRIGDLMHALGGADGALQGLGCSACALLAVGAVLVPHSAPAGSSELTPFQRSIRDFPVFSGDGLAELALSGTAARVAVADAAASPAGTPSNGPARTGRTARRSATSEPAPAADPTVPGASDLPPLPVENGPQDEVPVPKPPQGVREIAARITSSVTSAQVTLPRL